MKKIRFGVIGSGYMGRTHAEAIKRLETADLIAIWGGSRAPGLAQRMGVDCEASLEALVRRADIDAVVVTTPHHLHAPETILALGAGKHALIEKPMATSLADCDQMMAAANRHGLVLATAYNSRFRIVTSTARDLILADAIGRVLTMLIKFTFNVAAMTAGGLGSSWEWWNNPESVGYLINSFPHAIDLMRWYTGAEVATISAFSRTFLPGQTNEDTTMSLVEMTNGTLCSLYSSSATPAPAFPGEGVRFRIMGTRGLIDMDPFGKLNLGDKKGWRVVCQQPPLGLDKADSAFAGPRMEAFCDQIQSFIDGIHGQPMRAGSAADGRAAVEACLAMLQSSRERRWIQLGGTGA